jgi:hypothetical protein
MAGSPVVGAAIAQLVFWLLLIRGVFGGELRIRGALTCVGLWVAGYLRLPRLSPEGALFVTSWVAVLDIALVFVLFRGDVRLT